MTDLKAVQTLIVTLLPPEDVTTAGGTVVKGQYASKNLNSIGMTPVVGSLDMVEN